MAILLNPVLERIYVLDSLKYGNRNFSEKVFEVPSASGIVIARVAKVLGKEVLVCGFTGKLVGEIIKEKLQQEGIHAYFTKIRDSSRIATTIIEKDKNRQTMVVDLSPHVSKQELSRFERGLDEHIEKSDIIVIGGSLPRGIPPDFYAQLVKKFKYKGKRVILDSRGSPFFEAVKERPDIVKFDRNQIQEFIGINKPSLDQVLDFAWRLHIEGVDIVIVSLEEKGTIIAYDEKMVQAIPPKIRVANLFGSGDAFIAGFTIGIIENRTMTNVIKLAMSCALTNAMSVIPGQVEYSDIKKLFKRIKVKNLK